MRGNAEKEVESLFPFGNTYSLRTKSVHVRCDAIVARVTKLHRHVCVTKGAAKTL